MKTQQIEAILGYLEFHLLAFVEETEQNVSDPEVISDMYDRAYSILADVDRTLTVQQLLGKESPLPSNKKE